LIILQEYQKPLLRYILMQHR